MASVIFVLVMAVGAIKVEAESPNDSVALSGLKRVKVAFDMTNGDAKALLNQLNVIGETRDEVIREDAGGKEGVVSKGLATGDEIDRFRSVHYPSALGDKARHAVEPDRPAPGNPMSLDEAQEFITRLLKRWLDSK